MKIVTVRERRERALKKRRRALAEALERLAEPAARLGGRYRAFGSVVAGGVHMHSDLDVLADFPPETLSAAIDAAESVCRELGLPCNVFDQSACKKSFLASILPDSRVIG